MNKDQIKGRVKEVEGKTKEVAGKLVGNKALQTKGLRDKHAGKAQSGLGDLTNDLKKSY